LVGVCIVFGDKDGSQKNFFDPLIESYLVPRYLIKDVDVNRGYFIELFQYNDWANRQVWDCVMKTTEESYLKKNDFSAGSVYEQLLHCLSVERWWIGFLATGESKLFSEDDHKIYQDRNKLRQLWDETNEGNMVYIQSLNDDELQRKVKAPWWEVTALPITVAQALTHVANHSTDHRAQTMAVLDTLGYEGAAQDFLAYLGKT
jgi:uncharacterized damage-inducible protein DinB